MAFLAIETIQNIITDDNSTELLVKNAENLGRELANQRLTTSQIRSLFGEVRQIQAQWSMGGESRSRAVRRLILLKPKLAYRARKERGQAVQQLTDVLQPCVDAVVNERDDNKQNENFTRFVNFFEAILAYHKAYGGN